MELALLLKPLGYLLVVVIPAWMIVKISPSGVARILQTKIWDDPE